MEFTAVKCEAEGYQNNLVGIVVTSDASTAIILPMDGIFQYNG